MGTWGTGSFDNDTACDWAFSLAESNDFSLIEKAVEKILNAGSAYIETHDAEEALAAAEVVAHLLGFSTEPGGCPENVEAWVKKNQNQASPQLAKKAAAAIERLMNEPSEILELWQESEDFATWENGVTHLKMILSNSAGSRE